MRKRWIAFGCYLCDEISVLLLMVLHRTYPKGGAEEEEEEEMMIVEAL
jgi:hypothetical protein